MQISTDQAFAFKEETGALIEATLRDGRSIHFTVATSSMLPVLAPGDQVVVQRTRPADLRLGDIVLLKADETWIVHRLIGWRRVDGSRYLVTKGDNSQTIDSAWSAAHLCGRVIAVRRRGYRVNLQTVPSRVASLVLALFSRGEWRTSQLFPGFLGRVAAKGFRVLRRAGASILNRLAKETTG